MFEKLLLLPLFQGVSREKIAAIAEKTRFHFLKYTDGEPIVRRGEECTHLKFLLSESICSETASRNEKIRICERIHAPNLLAPAYLFGKDTHYPADMYAVGHTGIMQIDKQTFIDILRDEPICLINYLNILSHHTQRCTESQLAYSAGEIRERFAYWILSLTQRKSTHIRILCKQKDLYTFFGVQRSAFLNVLESLQEAGIVRYTPYEIAVTDRSRLRDVLNGLL